MEKIKQLIERQREEFNERFAPIEREYNAPGNCGYVDMTEDVKSFHSQSTKDLIDAVVEMEEGKKKKVEEMTSGGWYKNQENIGYNQAIDDTITQLLAIKEML